MTLVRYSGLVSGASGKLFGSVFAANRIGCTMRTLAPANKNATALQMPCRISLQQLSQAWANITSAQRKDWQQQAELIWFSDNIGKVYHPTGYNFFMSCNLNLMRGGLPFLTSPSHNIALCPNFPVFFRYRSLPFKDLSISFQGFTTISHYLYYINASRQFGYSVNDRSMIAVWIDKIPPGTSNNYNFINAYQSILDPVGSDVKISLRLDILDANSGVVLSQYPQILYI